MYSLDSLLAILGHQSVAILLAKMLIWAPLSQSTCTFFSVLTPVDVQNSYTTSCSAVADYENLTFLWCFNFSNLDYKKTK